MSEQNAHYSMDISEMIQCSFLTTEEVNINAIVSGTVSMGIIFGGQGGICHTHFWQLGGRISDPPTLLEIEKNHIFQYLFAFCGHFYWIYPNHMFSLSTYIQIF